MKDRRNGYLVKAVYMLFSYMLAIMLYVNIATAGVVLAWFISIPSIFTIVGVLIYIGNNRELHEKLNQYPLSPM